MPARATANTNRKPAGQRDGGQFTFGSRANELDLPACVGPPRLNVVDPLSTKINFEQWSFGQNYQNPDYLQRSKTRLIASPPKEWLPVDTVEEEYRHYDIPFLGKVVLIDDETINTDISKTNLFSHFATVVMVDWKRKNYLEQPGWSNTNPGPAKLADVCTMLSLLMRKKDIPTLLSRQPVDYVVTANPNNSPVMQLLLNSQQDWNVTSDDTSGHRPTMTETSKMRIVSPSDLDTMIAHSRNAKQKHWHKVRNHLIVRKYEDYIRLTMLCPFSDYQDMRWRNNPRPGISPVPPELTNLPHMKRITQQLWETHNLAWEKAKPGPINGMAFKICGNLSSMPTKEAKALIREYGGRISTAKNEQTSKPAHILVQGQGPRSKMPAHVTRSDCINEADLLEMISISESLN